MVSGSHAPFIALTVQCTHRFSELAESPNCEDDLHFDCEDEVRVRVRVRARLVRLGSGLGFVFGSGFVFVFVFG